MMNRSYLPFLSAREYQDRGMAKWMGFFLSEHSSSLWEEKNREDISISLSMEEKVLFVRQLYTNVFPATFVCKLSNRRKVVSGIVKNYMTINCSWIIFQILIYSLSQIFTSIQL